MGLSDKLSSALNVFLIGMLVYNIFFKNSERPKNVSLGVAEQRELMEAGRLLNSTGQLTEVGWSRKYLKEFSASDIYPVFFGLSFLKPFKFKKFDFYAFYGEGKTVQVAAANIFYGGSVFVNIYDYEQKRFDSFKETFLPYVDRALYPALPDNGFPCPTVQYKTAKGRLALDVYSSLKNGICSTQIKLSIDGELEAELTSHRNTADDDLFEVLPISDNFRYFYYNLKSYNNNCTVSLKQKGQEDLSLGLESCQAMSDHGRGVFEYKTGWVWGSAVGRSAEGQPLSLNFGGGIPNAKTATVEDSFKLGGRLHKLNPLQIQYDKLNLMNGLTLSTAQGFEAAEGAAGAAHFVFQAYHQHENKENFLVVASNIHYVYGKFSGWVAGEDGKVVRFEELPGFVEIAKMRW